eukprot:CAMPEP_0204617644 /NCGR_PEP_ID=MMETSP0717-20131115/4551_1 /ASSEMBLY_ACC=CAM_ASM_000666 /TAXON_ID=230516 /ORGANISM="Chaetoceros curvisetus" /LENGTH=348 /DNA_ID=CAMNT_0051631217 /DNA_START=38 /DNA_END=1084 /DNA_ORIENTATION=-
MKFINFTAIAALALLAASGVTEAKFAPSTFVAKKTAGANPALKEAFLAKESSSKAVSTRADVSSRGGDLVTAAMTRLTFYAEVIWTIGISVFMFLWLRSKGEYEAGTPKGSGYSDTFPNFNKQVLQEGFCINLNKADTFLGLGTFKICGIADLILVVGSYFLYKDRLDIGNNKLIYYGSAGYTLLHGAVHGFEVDQTGQLVSDENSPAMNALGVFLLAAITCFTPIGIKGIFEDCGKEGGLMYGVAAWIFFVAFYALGIKEKVYALTYINVTIFLSIFATRVFLMGRKDENRLNFYMGNNKMATVIAASANILIMCCEPLVCKDWFASVGGHLWFDVTLWLFMMSIMA